MNQVTQGVLCRIKIRMDCAMVATAETLFLVFIQWVVGRESFVAAAFFVGMIVKFGNRHLVFFNRFLGPALE